MKGPIVSVRPNRIRSILPVLSIVVALLFVTPLAALGKYRVAEELLLTDPGYGHEPWGVAVDAGLGLVYAADLAEPGMVTVIDPATHTIVRHIALSGLYAHGICVNDRTGRAYVANYGTDDLSVIDTAAAVEIGTIDVGDGPRAVAVNRVTDRIYVTLGYEGIVAVVDGETGEVVRRIGVDGMPHDVAVHEGRNLVFTANVSDWTVSVIDGAAGVVIDTVDVGRYPCGVSVNEATDLVYVTNRDDGTVSVIDAVSHAVVDLIEVGAEPQMIACNPETNRVYAANSVDGTVSVIDGEAGEVVRTVEVGRNPVGGIAVHPDLNEIYVANYDSDDFSVIDGRTEEVIATIRLGFYPGELTVDPGPRRLFVSNSKGNDLALLDGPERWAFSNVEVGYSPGSSALHEPLCRLFLLVPDRDELLVLDAETGALLHRAKTGSVPTGVAVNTATGLVYVSHSGSDDLRAYRCETLEPAAVVPMPFDALDVAVNERTNMIFVTVWMGLLVFVDGATHTNADELYLHGFCEPRKVAVNEVTDTVIVAALNCDLAWVADGRTHELLASIPLITFPGGVAVNPALDHAYVCTGTTLTVLGADHTIIEEVISPFPLTDVEVDPVRAQAVATSRDTYRVVIFQNCTDADEVGYSPEGMTCGPEDCDDGDPLVSPAAEEGPPSSRVCADGKDNDCDGFVDGDDPGCVTGVYTLELTASHESGRLFLDFTVGATRPSTWVTLLVLLHPTPMVLELWTLPLPVITPPVEVPISFPFPSLGTVGIFSGLYMLWTPQVTVLEWVRTE